MTQDELRQFCTWVDNETTPVPTAYAYFMRKLLDLQIKLYKRGPLNE